MCKICKGKNCMAIMAWAWTIMKSGLFFKPFPFILSMPHLSSHTRAPLPLLASPCPCPSLPPSYLARFPKYSGRFSDQNLTQIAPFFWLEINPKMGFMSSMKSGRSRPSLKSPRLTLEPVFRRRLALWWRRRLPRGSCLTPSASHVLWIFEYLDYIY